MVVFIALQLAILPLQVLLFLGAYHKQKQVEHMYKRSLMRLTHYSESSRWN